MSDSKENQKHLKLIVRDTQGPANFIVETSLYLSNVTGQHMLEQVFTKGGKEESRVSISLSDSMITKMVPRLQSVVERKPQDEPEPS
jgi:hypothetical protein